MRIRRIATDDSSWTCEIILDEKEWPPLDTEGRWMDRPLYRWIYDNCYPGVFFAAAGWILFEREDDAMMFQLVWG